jgi:hypothetical protein
MLPMDQFSGDVVDEREHIAVLNPLHTGRTYQADRRISPNASITG